jgi:hypothetical protein
MKWIAFAGSLALAGCGTIVRGATEQVQLVSEPSDALASTSLGHSCQTPCTVSVGRKDEFTVTFEKPGFERAQVPVTTAISGGGGASFAGNILVGGVIGMGADAATGAAYDHTPNPVRAALNPIPKPAEPPPLEGRRKRKGTPVASR